MTLGDQCSAGYVMLYMKWPNSLVKLNILHYVHRTIKYKMIFFVLFSLLFNSSEMKNSLNSKAVHESLVIEEEGSSRVPKIIDPASRQDFLCSLGSACTPLSECHLMTQLLKRSCLQTDKLRGLTCGYRGSEPLVCCPQTCPVQPPSTVAIQCGRPQILNWWATNYFGVGSHPWVVRVGFRNRLTNKVDYLCAGSIINERTVLTAAHCALAKTATHKIISCRALENFIVSADGSQMNISWNNIVDVRVGEYDCDQDPDCTYGLCAPNSADVPLNHIVVHPNYDSKTFSNNIALLVLKIPLNFSVSVQPICLYPKEKDYSFVNHKALLIGWGKLSGQISAPSSLQQIQLPVLPIESCLLLYGSSVPITDNELCVGGEGKDACSGFGGAPLVLLDPYSRTCYYQIGLLSFGSDRCGEEGIPSIYTRIDKYTDWIDINSPKV